MVRDKNLLEKFEDQLKAASAPDGEKALKIAEALYRQARSMGIFPLANPLDGIDVDIQLSARLRRVRTPA